MEIRQFEFCGVGMEVRSPLPLSTDGPAALFERPLTQPELLLSCRTAAQLSPQGTLLGQTPEKSAYRSEAGLQRCARAGQRTYAVLSYPEGPLQAAQLAIAQADWAWASQGLRFWIAAEFPTLLLHFQSLLFHASYIGYQGQGLLFTAPSQTGKSTQAALWQRFRGAEILNGDKAAVSLRGTPLAHSVPFSGTSGICQNVSLPLRAIVVLSQAPDNQIRCLAPREAAAALCRNLFADQLVPEEWALALNLVLDLTAAVPIYSLACTPDQRAVETLEQALA